MGSFVAQATQRYFDGRDVRLTADVVGDPRGDAIIFLHGGGQTRSSWGRALEAVAEAGFYGVSIDLRGHGESDWAPDSDYSFDAYRDDIRGVLAEFDRKPFVVGASLGGLIGLLLAGEDDATSGLVLVDIVPRFASKGSDRIVEFMTARPNGFATVDEVADAVAAYLPHRPRPSDTSGLLKNLRLHEDGRYYWHWDPAAMSKSNLPDPAAMVPRLEAAASKLTVPTLLVRGGRSDVVDLHSVQAFLALAPQIQLVDVAEAEHMVAGDRNDAFNNAVLQFLNEHRGKLGK